MITNDELFKKLESEVGFTLNCSNCGCENYSLGQKCSHLIPLGALPKTLDYEQFINPQTCTAFWSKSKLGREFMEKRELMFLECTQPCKKTLGNVDIWMMCRNCTNFIQK